LYTFEANPGTYRLLLDNIKVNGFKERATVVNKAVYSKSGKLPFYCLKHYQGDCRIFDFPDKRLEADMDEGQCIEVDAVALDDFFAQTDIHVDLIKMDAEGSEPYIFTGMETLLSRNKDARVICEFAPALVADAGNNPKEFLQYLLGYGFKLQVIDTASKIVETSIEDVLQSSHCELFLTR
jgi:FkbM family methyltransferase